MGLGCCCCFRCCCCCLRQLQWKIKGVHDGGCEYLPKAIAPKAVQILFMHISKYVSSMAVLYVWPTLLLNEDRDHQEQIWWNLRRVSKVIGGIPRYHRDRTDCPKWNSGGSQILETIPSGIAVNCTWDSL